jgi:pyruvate dehydrogenase E2 component (dihydrolipoamide acetyltransferase)
MSTEVTLPELGESVTEGTVSRWLKQVGDTINTDDPLLEISTDKVDTEIPSPASGTLLEIRVNEDDTVEVGAVLAVIGEASEADGSADTPEPDSEPAEAAPEPEEAPESQADGSDPAESSEPAEEAPAAEAEPAAQSQSGAASGTEVTLPELGESVTEGTISRWLKQVGDTVNTDDPLLEISTDKVDTEIPSPAAGTLLEIRANEDETVEVGAVLAVIGDASQQSAPAEEKPAPADEKQAPAEEPAPAEEKPAEEKPTEEKPAAEEPAPSADAPQAPAPTPAPAPSPAPSAPAATGDGPNYVTPLVRKLAAEHEVDLSSLKGTGVGGRIRKQDVLAAAEAKKAAAAPAPAEAPAAAQPAATESVEPSSLRGTTEKMSRLRKMIASRMVESLQTSAQLTTVVEVDLTVVSRLRAKVKDDFLRREGVKLSYLPFLIKGAVDALKVHPKLNATIDTDAGEIHYPASENVSIAVDTDKGLIVPVIKDAGDLSIAGLAKKIADLADRTRNNKLSPDDVAGGTFTVTNTGSRGALIDTPIVNAPQVAILGTGALVKRPVVMTDKVLGETIAIRDMMYLSLSYDHRLVDGADAARFLSTLKERLEEGDFGSEFGI